MAEQDVGGIALGLSLDTSGWSSGIAKAKSELEGLKRSAANIQIGVSTGITGGAVGGGTRVVSRGPAAVQGGPTNIGEVNVSPRFTVSAGSVRQLRTQINAQMRALAAEGGGIPINVTLGRVPYATMRAEISRGIGEVPIRIKPDAGSLTAFAAVLSAMTGQTPGRARQAIEQAAASRGIPARAQGGPAAANRPHLVGENGPEIHWPASSGTYIAPMRQTGGGIRKPTKQDMLLTQYPQALMERNLRRVAEAMSPDTRQFGRQWYGLGRQHVLRLAQETGYLDLGSLGAAASHDVMGARALNAAAALSPRNQWFSNLAHAAGAMRGFATGQPVTKQLADSYLPLIRQLLGPNAKINAGSSGIMQRELAKAMQALGGASREQLFPEKTNPKVYPFSGNLQGNLKLLTLDTIASQTATSGVDRWVKGLGVASSPEPGPFRDAMRRAHENVYEDYKDEFPEGIAQFQAALWTHYRGKPFAKGGFMLKGSRPWDRDDVMAWQNQLREGRRGAKFPTGLGGYGDIDPRWLPEHTSRRQFGFSKNALGGGVRPFCATCGTNIRDPRTHYSTAKHQANARGRSSSAWLSSQPGWAWGYRHLDEQYADPEGFVESDEWKKAHGRYRGGQAFTGPGGVFPGGVDLAALPRKERLAVGRRLYLLGKEFPYTASRMGVGAHPAVRAVSDKTMATASGWTGKQYDRGEGRKVVAGSTWDLPIPYNPLKDLLGKTPEWPYRREPYVWLNASLTPSDVAGLGTRSENLVDVATHEFGHAVDFVHSWLSDKKGTRAQMGQLGFPSKYAHASPSEHFAELFTAAAKGAKDPAKQAALLEMFNPLRAGDKALFGRARMAGGPIFKAVKPERFHDVLSQAVQVVRPSGRRVGETVHLYGLDEYRDMRTFLNADGTAGYAIKPDGDLVSVFNVGGPGGGKTALRSAIQRGATKLDAFDEVSPTFALGKTDPRDTQKNLPNFYRRFGFREVGRDPWDPAYAPEGWQGGRPDVVYMQRMKRKRAIGGLVGSMLDMGKYIVGEIGRELFVPKTREGDIPADVAAQLPGGGGLLSRILSGKAARGGGVMRDVGGKGSQYWNAPEDGWIIPNRLMHRVGRHAGGKVHSHPDRRYRGGSRYEDADGNTISQAAYLDASEKEMHARAAEFAASSEPYDPRVPSGRMGLRMQAAGTIPGPAGGGPDTRVLSQPTLDLLSRLGDENLPVLGRGVESFDRRAAERKASQLEYQKAIRGLTGRSSLGGIASYFLGGGRERAEAKAQISVAQQEIEAFRPRGVQGDVSEHFQRVSTTAEAAIETLEDYRKGLDKSSKDYEVVTRRLGYYNDKLETSSKTLEVIGGAQQREQEGYEKLQKGAGQNLLSVTAAGIAFNTGMQLAQAALDAATQAAAPLVDQLGGFTAANQKATKALAEQLPQVGTLQTLFAQTGLQSGLSFGGTQALQDQLGASVLAKAGATKLQQQQDLFRAASGAGAPSGLIGGFGGLFGTSVLGEQLGGGKGLFETLAQTTSTLRGGTAAPTSAVDRKLFDVLDSVDKTVYNAQQSVRGLFGASNNQVDVNAPTPLTPEQQAAARTQLEEANAALVRGGPGFGIAAGRGEDVGKQGQDALAVAEATKNATSESGKFILQMAQVGVVFRDMNGELVTTEKQAVDLSNALAKGLSVPDAQTFARVQAQALSSQKQLAAEQGKFERGTVIPGQTAISLLANPPIAAGAGLAGGSFSGGRISTSRTQSLQDQMMQEARQSITQMVSFVGEQLGPAAGQEFQGYVSGIQQFGEEIAAINQQVANSQARLNALQYAYSLRVINRQLADARGLAGQGGGSRLGQLQREQYELSRESQRLALESQRLQNEMAQRQINFQVAVAGFQAPGITGQERAARMEEAQVEASFAQRQLDIQKQQTGIAGQSFGVEGQVFQLQTQRAVEELEAQRGLLIQSHAVEQEQIAAQKQIAALTVRQSQLQGRAQSLFAEATGNFNAQLGASSQYVAQFGGTLVGVAKAIYRALSGTIPDARHNAGGHAAGILFDTSGSTDMTVGEAGRETVAVLRNPRRMSLGGPAGMAAPGGGGGNIINVSITGNNISSEMDLETITRKVSNAVEDALGRKANLLGVNAI